MAWGSYLIFLTETNLFHLHRIFKNGGERVQTNPLNPLWILHWLSEIPKVIGGGGNPFCSVELS